MKNLKSMVSSNTDDVSSNVSATHRALRLLCSCMLAFCFHNLMADDEISENKAIGLLDTQIKELMVIARKAKNVDFEPYENIQLFPELQKLHAPDIERCKSIWAELKEGRALNVPKPVFTTAGKNGEIEILKEIMAYTISGNQVSNIDFERKGVFNQKTKEKNINDLRDLIKMLENPNRKTKLFDEKYSIYMLYLYKNDKDDGYVPKLATIHLEKAENGYDFSMIPPQDIREIKEYYDNDLIIDTSYDGFLSKMMSENKNTADKFAFSETYDPIWKRKIPWLPRPGVVKGFIEYQGQIVNFYVAESNYRSPIAFSPQEIADGRIIKNYEFHFFNSNEKSSCEIKFNL